MTSPQLLLRLLVVNGCSMAFGDELPDRLRTGWAALLARKLGIELINLAACGGSNHRIVRTTVERLDQLTWERRLLPEQVLFLGMWSRMNRFEVYTGEPDPLKGLPEDYPDPGWCRIHPLYIDLKDRRSIAWYRELHHDDGVKKEFLVQWVMFDAWLASRGYRRGYLWAFDPDPEILTQQPEAAVVHGGPSIFSVGEQLEDLGPRRHPLVRTQQHFVDKYLDKWVDALIDRGK